MRKHKRIRDILFPVGGNIRLYLRKMNRFVHCLFNFKYIKEQINNIKEDGLKDTIRSIKEFINTGVNAEPDVEKSYQLWIKYNEPSKEELENQKNYKFEFNPKISIIVPMFHTPIDFFEELVNSLINQTYSNWELCLADGSETRNEEIEEICKKDQRIKYKFIGKNGGISANTNEALDLVTGDYVALLDHDDFLPQFSLFEIVKCINENRDVEFIYTDEDKYDDIQKKRFSPHFKPDFGIDTLRSHNFICHFSIFKKELMDKLGGFRPEFDGSQDYDIILRMSEHAKKIIHISKILYQWRVHELSTAKAGTNVKPYAYEAAKRALQDHIDRVGLKGTVDRDVELIGTYKIKYDLNGQPKVTIIIPNKNNYKNLKSCINSILKITSYKNYEIVIVDDNSDDDNIIKYYDEIQKNENIQIIKYKENNSNYAKLINYAVKKIDTDYIIQLHSNTEILVSDWIEEMLGFAQRNDVGAVGVMALYPDKSIEHAGLIVGMNGIAGYVFEDVPNGVHGYFVKDCIVQNLSAVASTCIMTSKKVFDEIGYMDEKLTGIYSDVDFCLKIRNQNKLIVYNPNVEIIHYIDKDEKAKYQYLEERVDEKEEQEKIFKNRWGLILKNGDSYYNKNLRLDNAQYKVKSFKV